MPRLFHQRREALINYINAQEKTLFPFMLEYDKSLMSRERLLQYKMLKRGRSDVCRTAAG